MQARLSRAGKVVFLLVGACLSGCGSSGIKAPVAHDSRHHAERAAYHTVRKGETLSGIAWRHALDYRQVAAWNGVRAPYTIFPGQRLRLIPPATPHQTSQTAPRTVQRPVLPSPSNRASSMPQESSVSRSDKRQEKEVGSSEEVLRWRWPAEASVVNGYDNADRKGIDIGGKLGQPIYAAADGYVVYSGSGLRGYGKLIIIKHNNRFLSAYAHNNNLLVAEGDRVIGGQRIAEMGQGRGGQAMLYFEIRRDGRPVDPMRYLPRVSLKEESHVERIRDGWGWGRA
ncbi:MAG: peptidoglycan DD-metalloendopeptidase family protein [Gammaproteobacteria bacterium]